ncbi:ArsR/SmtB family transcription factor [Melghirimyces algeriensis]|uniref:Transcriptional regulator, ArsR family n=1 Tax=Melghirimyces algeriensis TaxID=910412 RepID=A0A521CE47_9BACL|nr:metalloregulator ArsR/SmtB family transcription factor [Melghirimyces algeriensis]SMO57703.1 transcriptional regulator, ArsR family [Melghirimyces algeriensis]
MKEDVRMLKDGIYGQFARIGKALSSPRRLELLDLLSQGPKSVETLSRETMMSVANVSQHLQTLLEARLVIFEKKGTYAIYRLSSSTTSRLLLLMQELAEELLAEVKQLREQFYRGELEAISLEGLQDRMQNEDVILIDVRPKEEYEYAHIPGAYSVPITELEQHLKQLPPEQKIVAYCRGRYCVYAAQAVDQLRSHGYQAVRLEEGIREWKVLSIPE